jgi:hypothetical protein
MSICLCYHVKVHCTNREIKRKGNENNDLVRIESFFQQLMEKIEKEYYGFVDRETPDKTDSTYINIKFFILQIFPLPSTLTLLINRFLHGRYLKPSTYRVHRLIKLI